MNDAEKLQLALKIIGDKEIDIAIYRHTIKAQKHKMLEMETELLKYKPKKEADNG